MKNLKLTIIIIIVTIVSMEHNNLQLLSWA